MSEFKLDLDLTGVKSQEDTDSVGGGYYLTSGLHKGKVEAVYLEPSTKEGSKSLFAVTRFVSEDGTTAVLRNCIKGRTGLAYYLNKNKEKVPQIGLTKVNALVALITGKLLQDGPAFEDLPVTIFDNGTEKKVVKKVLTGSVGFECQLGLRHRQYIYNGKSKHKNDLDKAFNKDGLSPVEAKAGVTEPTFAITWAKANEGKIWGENGFAPLTDAELAALNTTSTTVAPVITEDFDLG